MAYNSDFYTAHSGSECDPPTDMLHLTVFFTANQLVSHERMRDFELLRLAMFVLKLRNLERSLAQTTTDAALQECAFQHRLLHHVIFQQVLALTALNARREALTLITASHNL